MAIKIFLELPPEYRKGVIEWGRSFAEATVLKMGLQFLFENKFAPKPKLASEKQAEALLKKELNEVAKVQLEP